MTASVDNAFKFTHRGSIKLDIAPVSAPGSCKLRSPSSAPQLDLRELDAQALLHGNRSKSAPSVLTVPDIAAVDATTRLSIRFTVTDTGIGCSPEALKRVLAAPFTQADESTTKIYGGTGLGLTLCKQLLEQMNSKLEVESQPGVGSTFGFVLSNVADADDGNAVEETPSPRRVAPQPSSSTSTDASASPAETKQAAVNNIASRHAPPVAATHAIMTCLDAEETMRAASVPLPPSPLQTGQAAARATDSQDTKMSRPTGLRSSSEGATPTSTPGSSSRTPSSTLRDACYAPSTPIGATQLKTARAKQVSSRRRSFNLPASDILPLSILCAEDNLVNQKVMMRLLAKHRVTMAANGQIAVDYFTAPGAHYDLVLLDQCMPVLDGCGVARKIREWERQHLQADESLTVPTLSGAERELDKIESATPAASPASSPSPPRVGFATPTASPCSSLLQMAGVPIVAVTAAATLEDSESMAAAEVNHVITKPINMAHLDRVLRFANRRAQQMRKEQLQWNGQLELPPAMPTATSAVLPSAPVSANAHKRQGSDVGASSHITSTDALSPCLSGSSATSSAPSSTRRVASVFTFTSPSSNAAAAAAWMHTDNYSPHMMPSSLLQRLFDNGPTY